MKKRLRILIIIISFFSLILNVNAAGYSGDGVKFNGKGGGKTGTCNGGFCLNKGAILKFTIVDISSGSLIPKARGIMLKSYRDSKNTKLDDYSNKYFNDNNFDTSKAVRGIILDDGSYSYSPYGIANYQILPEFSTMKSIFDSSIMTNFSAAALKNAVISNASSCSEDSTDCTITSEYDNIVTTMLKNAGLIRGEVGSVVTDLNNEEKNKIANYRMIIEPVYAFKKNNESKYIFATTKAAAMMIPESFSGSHYLGVYIDSLYKNLIAEDIVGPALNNYPGGYPLYYNDTVNQLKALRNPNDGAGYAIVKLLYDIETPATCVMEKDEAGKIIFYDSIGNAYENDSSGVNLEHFITDCGCDVTYNDVLFNEIEDIPTLLSKYYNKCPEPTNPCTYNYNESESTYYFFGKTGEKLGSYAEFRDACKCSHENVKTLGETVFTRDYMVCKTGDSEGASSDLRMCSGNVSEYNLEYTKITGINNYCSTTCTEDIKVNNLVTKNYYNSTVFTAGKYYELPGMLESNSDEESLSVTGTKICKTTIDYDEWYEDYEDLLENIEYAYNNYKRYTGCERDTDKCRCDKEGNCSTLYIYECEFTNTKMNSRAYPATLETGYDDTAYHSYCRNNRFGTQKSNAWDSYVDARNAMTDHLDDLEECNNNIISKGTRDTEFYQFKSELEYHYQQTYKKVNDVPNKQIWNENRMSVIGDINETDQELSKYTSDYNRVETNLQNALVTSTSIESQYKPVTSSSYTDGVKESSSSGIFRSVADEGYDDKDYNNEQTYERMVQYRYYYRPSVGKYVDTLTGEISSNDGDLVSPSWLGYVYDLDVSAQPLNNNKTYYNFTALGDASDGKINGIIYDWFKNKVGQPDKLKRSCEYKISNKVVCENLAMCINYRMVDPNNIDPNNRLTDNSGDLIELGDINAKGFNNWRDVKGMAVYEKLKETDTFNPDNIEYSFTLNSQTIKNIREYSKSISYDSIDIDEEPLLECDAHGNECESKFITDLSEGEYGDNVRAKLTGRDRWKYLIYNSSGKWSIVEDNKDENEYNRIFSSTNKYEEEGVMP